MNTNKLLWLGFGDLGMRAAAKFKAMKVEVTGVARSAHKASQLDHLLQGRLDDTSTLEALKTQRPDIVIMTLSPDERSESGYRRSYFDGVQRVLPLLQIQAPRALIYVSSSRVYGCCQGEVDESTRCEPDSAEAKILLQTETLLQSSKLPTCIVRFSGIYGPGRQHLLNQVRAGEAGDDSITNRIHVDDCVGILQYLAEKAWANQPLPQLILASDSEPARSSDVRSWLAKQMGYGDNHLKAPAKNAAQLANKRCNNSLLLSLGYQFKYPDFRAGYAAVLDADQ